MSVRDYNDLYNYISTALEIRTWYPHEPQECYYNDIHIPQTLSSLPKICAPKG